MHDNYNILENLLQRSRFHSSKEDVLYLIDLGLNGSVCPFNGSCCTLATATGYV